MRNTWKIAVAFTLVLGLGGALAQAQLITGNTAANGGGPIYTWDFATANIAPVGSFVPFGATNGRGLAIGGTEVFYTELANGLPPFGATDVIRVVPLNNGAGGAQIRTLPNPRSGSGISDLTFSNGTLYVLTGYDTQVPIVYGLNLVTGAVIKSGVTIAQPAATDRGIDGFAVLPNGNFLMNDGDTSCIYREYSSVDGHLIGNTINVPANNGLCTGVDTDGTSLYFLTDFNSITKTNFLGTMIDFNLISGTFDDDGEIKIEDISLVHPVTIITETGPANLFFTIKNTDDINTNFDIRAELLLNDSVIGTGLTRCVPTAGPVGTFIGRNIPGHSVTVPITLSGNPVLVSGDVVSMRVSTRIGTNPDNTIGGPSCAGHFSAVGLRFFYDSVGDPSQFKLTIQPNPSQTQYFHSDGTTCTNALGETQPTLTLNRTLSNVAPVGANPRCKEVGALDGRFGNPFLVFSTWYLAALP